MLPLGPTGYGDSPYQCFSAFAGNPLLISLERLVEQGLLPAVSLSHAPCFPDDFADYGRVIPRKMDLLRSAGTDFLAHARGEIRNRFDAFCTAQAAWLDDYALFMALKHEHGQELIWTHWGAGRPRAPNECYGGGAGAIGGED